MLNPFTSQWTVLL